MFTTNKRLTSGNFLLGTLLRSTLFHYDQKTDTLRNIDNYETERRKFNMRFGVSLCIGSIIIIQYFTTPQQQLDSRVRASMYIGLFLGISSFVNVARINSEERVLYYNGLGQFEKMYVGLVPNGLEARRSPLVELNILFGNSFAFSAMGLAFGLAYGLHWTNPNQPTVAGYLLLGMVSGDPANGYIAGPMLTQGILLVNYWMWAWLLSGFTPDISVFIIAGSIRLLDAVEWFQHLSTGPNMAVGKTIRMYRHIQLINCIGNHCLKGTVTTGLLISIFGIGAGVAMFFKSLNDASLLTLLVLAIIFVNATAAILILVRGLVAIFAKSKEVFQVLKRLIGESAGNARDIKLWTRFLASFKFLKTAFGGNNHLEELTPLRSLDAGIGLAVNLLLID